MEKYPFDTGSRQKMPPFQTKIMVKSISHFITVGKRCRHFIPCKNLYPILRQSAIQVPLQTKSNGQVSKYVSANIHIPGKVPTGREIQAVLSQSTEL